MQHSVVFGTALACAKSVTMAHILWAWHTFVGTLREGGEAVELGGSGQLSERQFGGDSLIYQCAVAPNCWRLFLLKWPGFPGILRG